MGRNFQIGKVTEGAEEMFKDNYELLDMEKRFSFGTQYLCRRYKDSKKFTCRIFKKKKMPHDEVKELYRELRVMKCVISKSFVELHEVYESEHKIMVVEERLAGQELFDAILERHNFAERHAAHFLEWAADGLMNLHRMGIVHRDVRPETFRYHKRGRDAAIKFKSFTLAKKKASKEDGMFTTICGTPHHLAPEMVCKKPYDEAVDVWSLGVTLYILLCGYPPFHDEDRPSLFKSIKKAKFEFREDHWGHISDGAKDIITRMLTVDPEKRITMKEVTEHKWVCGGARKHELGKRHKDALKRHQARKKLRLIIIQLIALNRLHALAVEDFT